MIKRHSGVMNVGNLRQGDVLIGQEKSAPEVYGEI
jgi:hypothetical protein